MKLKELLQKKYLQPADHIIVSEAIKEFESMSNEIDSLRKQIVESKISFTASAIHSLLNVSPETSMLIDKDGKILAINEATASRLGTDTISVLGKCIFDFFDRDVADIRRAKCNEVFASKKPISFEDRNREKIFETYIYPVIDKNSEVKELAIFSQDVTEKRKIQEQLKESELKYRTLVERSKDGILIIQDGFLKFANQSLIDFIGSSSEDVINKHFSEFIHPDSLDFVTKRYESRMDGKKVPSIYETTLINRKGEPLPVELNVGKIVYQSKPAIIVSIRDIRERKIAEAKIKESERLLRKIIDLVPHHIFAKDKNGKFLLVNNTVAKMYGKTVETVEGKHHQIIHPDEQELKTFLEEDAKVIQLQQPLFIPEHKFTDSNGNISILQTIKIPFKYGNTNAVLGVAIDITELKNKEKEIKRIKNEEENYQAMLNHFINNDLQKIVSNLEYLLLEYDSLGKLNYETIEEILRLAHHSSQIISKVNKIFEILQTSFKPDHSSKLEISAIIAETRRDLENNKVSLNIRMPDDLNGQTIPCNIDIKDAFYEIFLFISESTPKDVFPEVKIKINQYKTKIEIIVEDNFSTKVPEELSNQILKRITDSWELKGHFIGLTLAAIIIQYYNGTLIIEPGIDKGNTFKISF